MVKKKVSDTKAKAYGMPVRIKAKTVSIINILGPKKEKSFDRKLYSICKELADMKGIDIE
jgi:hypothetical protein